MYKTALAVCLFAAGIPAVSGLAAPKANFSGTWKLNEKAAKSKGPRNIVFQIEHKDPAFQYSATGETADGERFTEAVAFTTDGKEHPGVHSGTVTARWEGEALVVVYKIGSNQFTMTLRLSTDGKQMFRDILGQHEVYDKQ